MIRALFRNRLARAIWMVRIARGLSQNALAERAGTSRSAISNIERGQRLPNVVTLERMAKSLRVASWVLLKITEID